MKKRYKIRQKIIDNLYNKITYSDIDVPKLTATKTELKVLAEEINVPYKELFDAHHGIPDTQARCVSDDGKHSIVLAFEGVDASISKYWLREGQKESNEMVYDKVKWLVPIIALIITAGSLSYTICTITETRQEIEEVKEELSALKAQKTTPNQNQSPPRSLTLDSSRVSHK